MFEIAVRIKELTESNINSLVERASSPAKMLRLLQLELEEAIIALDRDAGRADRRARDSEAQGAAQVKAAADWREKAKLALANDRDDLARGALAEREKAERAGEALRQTARDAEAEAAALREAVAALEAKLGETRAKLASELAIKDKPKAAAAAPVSAASRSERQVEALNDRISTLEKRIDFAQASADAASKSASLDEELSALQRESSLDAEMAALRAELETK